MEDRPRPPLRRSVSPGRQRYSYDASSVHTASPLNDRGVRKSAISNIYKPTSPNTTPLTVTPPRRGRGTQGRPVSSSDHGNNNSSARKSTVTNASRHSDGSGISIRYSIAPRTSGSAYRSFSGASDILPGTPSADDANSDVVDYDEIAPGSVESAPQFPLPIREAPQDEVEQIEFENDNDAVDANVVRRGYMGIPGFYYDHYSSNYNSSEEELDDSSVSDVYGARPSSPVDVDVIDETECPDLLGNEPNKQSQQEVDDDDHARLIEVDAKGKFVTRRPDERNGLGYRAEIDMDGSDYDLDYASEASQHIPDFDQDNDHENELRWSQTGADTKPSITVIHPPVPGPGEIAATFDFVYRVRDIIPEEDVRARQAAIRADTQRPKRALIPVYSEGLSLSTFPYVNSLAPISTIVRQQPRGHYATTVVGARHSAMSTILPPMPTQPPAMQTGINAVVGQRYGRTVINHQEKAGRLSAEEDVDYSQLEAHARWEDEEQVDLDDPLEILRQLRMHQQEAWNDSMFTFHMQQNSPATIPRERRPCSKGMARLLLAVFICFPPLWLVMGCGGLDNVVGEIPLVERIVAKIMGASIFVAVIIGLGVGLGVGL
ncbi:uncharacterized protein V1513DRAFT_428945 [Lipomyces chichibuensis]|uniref:uncharacterized protein n=1 Tax=Lipomyces chichibuensis TaxID=1546026 RepID=UPI00334356A6